MFEASDLIEKWTATDSNERDLESIDSAQLILNFKDFPASSCDYMLKKQGDIFHLYLKSKMDKLEIRSEALVKFVSRDTIRMKISPIRISDADIEITDRNSTVLVRKK